MTAEEIYSNLCFYDLRNPNGSTDNEAIEEHIKEDCYCDNCFYGRTKLAEYIINLNQTTN